jgi:cytochrome c2
MNIKISNLYSWLVWHVLIVLAIFLLVSQLKVGSAYWNLPKEVVNFLCGFFVTYSVSVAVVGLRYFFVKRLSFIEVLLLPLAIFSLYFFYLLITESYYSRSLLLIASVLSSVSILFSFLLKPKLQVGLAAVLIIFAVSLQVFDDKPTNFFINVSGSGPKPAVSSKLLKSSLYTVEILSFRNHLLRCEGLAFKCNPPPTGGGIAEFGDGYLLSTGEGKLYFLSVNQNDKAMVVTPLSFSIPINENEYLLDVVENIRHTFRVTDIMVLEQGSRFELYAAHHYWKFDKKCGVLRVSKISGELESFLDGTSSAVWETFFETNPCIPAAEDGLTRGGESGGRLGMLSSGSIVLTVGDHEYDGIIKQPIMAQDPKTSYGKILTIDPVTRIAELYSMGHRNPQGLHIDKDGLVWATEHGPRGGDEFNKIDKGGNYGWPLVTYGTQYGMLAWPLSSTPGRHDGFKQPMFTWVESIAISNLVRLDGKLFSLWKGDFIIASLTKKIFRVRVVEGRVTFVESMAIPFSTGRIRDLFEDKQGRIVLYMDDGSVNLLSPILENGGTENLDEQILTAELRGQYLFSACMGCHKIEGRDSHGIGPDLSGIVGRKIAGARNYQYSNALANYSGVWTKEKLDQYLANPQEMVPGTTMAYPGVSDRSDRKAIIEYLEKQK